MKVTKEMVESYRKKVLPVEHSTMAIIFYTYIEQLEAYSEKLRAGLLSVPCPEDCDAETLCNSCKAINIPHPGGRT